jgi:hypothetical protein
MESGIAAAAESPDEMMSSVDKRCADGVEGVTEGLSGGLMHTAATSPEVVVLFQGYEGEYPTERGKLRQHLRVSFPSCFPRI